MYENSTFLNLINKLDIKQSTVENITKNSFIIQKPLSLLNFIGEKSAHLSENSLFIQKIDYFIFALMVLLIASLSFASTGLIGLISLPIIALSGVKFLVKKDSFSLTGLDVPIFLYIAIAALSVAFSSLFIPSLKGFSKILIFFALYLSFTGFVKDNPKRVFYLIITVAITIAAESIAAIFQQINGVEAIATWQDISDVNPEQLMDRAYGTLKPYNPNLLAGFLVAGFSSVLASFFIFLHRKNYALSALFFFLSILTLAATVLTGSRGGYLAIAMMMIVFTLISGHIIWHDYDKKWLKNIWKGAIIAAIAGVIALIAFSPAIQHRIASIFAYRDDSSNSYRFNVYISTIKMFLDNWLIGIGTGNATFRLTYGLYMLTGYDALGAYNIFLEIAAESGIFCLLSFLWLIIMSFIKGIKTILFKNSLENKIIVSACLIAIAGMMTHGMVDTIWYRPQVSILFWMIIAILGSITANSKSEQGY